MRTLRPPQLHGKTQSSLDSEVLGKMCAWCCELACRLDEPIPQDDKISFSLRNRCAARKNQKPCLYCMPLAPDAGLSAGLDDGLWQAGLCE